MKKLVGSLSRWCSKLDDDGRREAFARIGKDCDGRFRQFLEVCFIPMITKKPVEYSLLGRILRKLRSLLIRRK